MRFIINIFALVGIFAVISISAMEFGCWPDNLWHPRIKRVITQMVMGPEVGTTNDVIIGVCNPSAMWSPRSRMDVVEDIRFRGIQYFLRCKDETLADVLVFYNDGSNKWFIKTAYGTNCNFTDPGIPKKCDPSAN